jgi:chemotaxis signal transduction protein
MKNNYLLFRLGERLFGVKMIGALEILPWRRSRPVPLSYSYVEGVMEYRATIFPVFHLSLLLGLSNPGPIGFTAAPHPEKAEGRSIILLQERNRPFGVTVDGVMKMAPLEDPEGRAPDIRGINPQVLAGVRYEDDQEIILLSFERLFHAG